MSPSLWDQYRQLVGLFRYYLDLGAKTASLYWLVTGGVATLTFANAERPGVEWALVVPILLSGAIVLALFIMLPSARELRDSIAVLATEAGLRQPVHAEILVWLIHGLIIMLLVSVALLVAAFAALSRSPGTLS